MNLHVAPCPHGRGVFATVKLLCGEHIAFIDDLRITAEPTSSPEKRWALIIGQSGARPLFWDAEPLGSRYYWTNFLDHNEHPNVKFEIDLKSHTAILETSEDIKAREELFLNYHDYDPRNWPHPR